jgi:hypothetical protein
VSARPRTPTPSWYSGDEGAERDTREPKPCCNRLADGSRCLEPVGHSKACVDLDPDAEIRAAMDPVDALARVAATRDQIFAGYTKGRSRRPGAAS